MLIHAPAEIPLQSELLNDALHQFARFVKRHFVASEGAEVSIALTESGAGRNSALAKGLPDGSATA